MDQKRNKAISVATRTAVCAVLLGGAGGLFWLLVHTKSVPGIVAGAGPQRRVEVMRPLAVPVRREWSGFGTAAAVDSADVPAEIAGIVAEVPPRVVAGAAIGEGEVLAVLDSRDFLKRVEVVAAELADVEARLAQLQVEYDSWAQRVDLVAEEAALARTELERIEAALARDAAKQREVDQARMAWRILQRAEISAREELAKVGPRRAQLEAQRAGLEARRVLAERDRKRCTISSPLAGVVGAVDVEAGESVAAGQRIARVVSLRRVEVALRLPASARATVSEGDQALLEAAGSIPRAWSARVGRIGPEDDESTRTMVVYVDLEQDPRARDVLVPGRFVQATVVSAAAELRTVVPRRSLLGDRLLLVEEGLVRSRPVRVEYHVRGVFPELGVTAEQWAVLAERLPEEALVVVNASRTLVEGAEVEVVPAAGAGLRGARAAKEPR